MKENESAEVQDTPDTEAEDLLFGKEDDSVSAESSTEVVKEDTSEEEVKEDDSVENKSDTEDNTESKEISYDELVLSEDSKLSEDILESIKEFAKEANLSSDQAKKILDNQDLLLKEYEADLKDSHDKQISDWEMQVRNDPELGRDKFEETLKLTDMVMKKFGDEQLLKDLTATGYGNHPGLVRFVTRVGRAMSDDSIKLAGDYTPKREKTIEDIFYGNDN